MENIADFLMDFEAQIVKQDCCFLHRDLTALSVVISFVAFEPCVLFPWALLDAEPLSDLKGVLGDWVEIKHWVLAGSSFPAHVSQLVELVEQSEVFFLLY